MKMTVDKANVVRGGCKRRERRFDIKATGKGYQILSAGIYTDHIAAILRELACNAADSHTANGKPLSPVLVHLPNQLEPFLSIEDYDGVGLDDIEVRGQYACPNCEHTENSDFDEEVCPSCGCKLTEANYEPGIYTTYFDSNKTDDDDVTGCLGLGSKTPLAYTDNFSVTAVKDGERNVYSAYLDEEKCPCIVRMHTEPTDAPNGVKVEMAVKPDDFDTFIYKAGYIYQWFTTKPEISGVTDFEYPENQDFLMETDDYGIINKDFDSSSSSSTAVLMGNVRYALNFSDFNYDTREKFTEVETMLLKHGITLKVSLKEGCDVAASREKLQMTARSVEVVKAKLALAEMDCLVEVQKRIDECTTMWDARCTYGKLMENTILGAIAKKSEVEPEWKGEPCRPFVSFTKKVKDTYLVYPTIDNAEDWDGEPIIVPGPPQQKETTVNITQARGVKCFLRDKRRRSRFGGGETVFDKETVDGVKIRDGIKIVVQDTTHGSYAAVERFLRENGEDIGLVYLVSEINDEPFLKNTHLNEVVVLVSTLPKPDRMVRVKQKKTAKAVRFVGDRDAAPSRCWEDHKIEDLDEGGVYVEVHRYNWKAGKLDGQGIFQLPCLLNHHIPEAQAIGDFDELIGLRKALVEKVKNNPKWVRLDDHIINCMKAQANLVENANKYGVWLALSTDDVAKSIVEHLDGCEDWANHSVLGILLSETAQFRDCGTDDVQAFRSARSRYSDLINGHLPDGIDYTSVIEGLTKQWNELNDHYPMLSFCRWGWNMNESKVDKVVEYVDAIDGHTRVKVAVVKTA